MLVEPRRWRACLWGTRLTCGRSGKWAQTKVSESKMELFCWCDANVLQCSSYSCSDFFCFLRYERKRNPIIVVLIHYTNSSDSTDNANKENHVFSSSSSSFLISSFPSAKGESWPLLSAACSWSVQQSKTRMLKVFSKCWSMRWSDWRRRRPGLNPPPTTRWERESSLFLFFFLFFSFLWSSYCCFSGGVVWLPNVVEKERKKGGKNLD